MDVGLTQARADVRLETKLLRAKSRSNDMRSPTGGPSRQRTSSTSASKERHPADSVSTEMQKSKLTPGSKTLTGKL